MNVVNPIYFDHAATTKPRDEVVALYTRLEQENFGNSSSIHALGVKSQSYENKAKELILKTLKLEHYRVVFTSGSTEANNLMIIGCARKYKNRGKHLITSNIEHPSVLECFKALEKEGFEVTYLPVNKNGEIEPEQIKKAMRDDTILVSIMSTNNEIGSRNNLNELAKIVHQYPKAIFHSDTTQSIGKDTVPFNELDAFVISGHKIHGLKGSGCLILKDKISLEPIIYGGGQEDGFRSGTVAVSLCCTLAKAVSLAYGNIEQKTKQISRIYQQILDKLHSVVEVEINSNNNGSPYILNFSLKSKKASVVVEALSNQGIYVSSVSACHSKNEQSSYVVAAIGKNEKLSANTIRLSFGKDNTIEEAEAFVSVFTKILESIR